MPKKSKPQVADDPEVGQGPLPRPEKKPKPHVVQLREFNYVDAMPGAGKTEYFITQAIKLLSKKQPTRALIYVAPTILLLQEALTRIAAHPGFEKSMARRVILVTSPKRVNREHLPMRCITYREAPKKVINYMLGLSDTCGTIETLPTTVQPGDLILTTHESFVQVNHRDPTGRDFATLKNCDVIFDEARHCVIEHRSLPEISNEHLIRMREAFAFHPSAFRMFDVAHTESTVPNVWYVYNLTDALPVQRMKAVFGVKSWASIPPSIRKLHKDVRLFSDSGRASVFIMVSVNTVELMTDDTRNSRIVAYTLHRPTSLFNGYRSVTLTSAFFKDSHMYHFLKEDGHTFHDLRSSKLPELTSIYKRDLILREALSKRLVVGVLMRENGSTNTQKEYRNNLTSNLLSSGMVVPAKLTAETLDRTVTMHNQSLPDLIDALHSGEIVAKNPVVQKTLVDHASPPLWLLIKEAARLIERAWELKIIKRPKSDTDYDNLALLVLNVSRGVWSNKQIPYAAVVQALYARGKLADRSEHDDGFHSVYSREERQMMNTTSKLWRKELARHLFIGSPESKFVIPPTNRLHGINRYSKLNAFVHLAALNPTPQLIAFYKIILGPEYDIDQDHSIESLVQMLYRTSLRMVDVKTRVLMIVPYAAQAKLLQAKIDCDDFFYMNTPRLTQWHHRRSQTETERAAMTASARKISAVRRRLNIDDDEKRQLKSMRVSIRRFRNLIADDPLNEKASEWKAKLISYEVEVARLTNDPN